MREDSILMVKVLDFAEMIVDLYRKLSETPKEYVHSKQILRSGTSIGANIAEAMGAQSRPDFIAKLHISLKECNETEYWLILLQRTGFIDTKNFNEAMAKLKDILNIETAILKKMKGEL